MIKGTGDAVKAVKENPTQSLIIALAIALLGGGTGIGGSMFAENRSSDAHDREVAQLQRELDRHISNYQRAMDRRDRDFDNFRRDVRMAILADDSSFLMGVMATPPAAATVEIFEEDGPPEEAEEDHPE